MKQLRKKWFVVACMLLCVCSLAACGKKDSNKVKYFGLGEDNLNQYGQTLLDSYNSTDFTAYDEVYFDSMITQGATQEDVDLYKNFAEVQKVAGAFVELSSIQLSETDDSVKVQINAKYENRKVKINAFLDSTGNISSITAEYEKTFGELMEKAAMNTLMGMGSVFMVLIFISFVIFLLRFINPDLRKRKQQPSTSVDHAIETIELSEQEELSDDLELVAVITAAIMASMGDEAKADGFVVRSIRKVGTRNWKRA